MKIQRLISLPVLAVLALTACDAGVPPQPDFVTVTPTAQAQPGTPTALAATIRPTLTPSPSPAPTDTPEANPTETATPTMVSTESNTPEPNKTATTVPTETIPVPTQTPEPTPTPAPSSPVGKVTMQANCRYGPGTAYLYAHGMYAGDEVQINGRSVYNSWLWVKPANLERHCWAAPSVMEIRGDLDRVPRIQHNLPKTTYYWPPQNVQTVRDGNQVTVSWDRINMTVDKDRGYLLEVTVCQNGGLIWMAVRTDNTWYTFTDEGSCAGKSGGRLYTAEKHGYTDPVVLDWP